MKKFFTFIISSLFSLNVLAAIIEAPISATARHPGGAVVHLHTVEGPCVGGAFLATIITASKEKIQGCWKASDSGVINIVWFDTDTSSIPIQVFQTPEAV